MSGLGWGLKHTANGAQRSRIRVSARFLLRRPPPMLHGPDRLWLGLCVHSLGKPPPPLQLTIVWLTHLEKHHTRSSEAVSAVRHKGGTCAGGRAHRPCHAGRIAPFT
jgi:hypothetical protein